MLPKRAVLLFILAATGMAVAAAVWTLRSRAGMWFVAVSPPLSVVDRMLDVGIVDLDGDDRLDVFTSNHHFRQSLLLADGKGGYRDVLSERGLDQSRAFPGAELSFVAPEVSDPGVYVYWFGTNVVIRGHRMRELGEWHGTLRVHDPVVLVKSDGFRVNVRSQTGIGEESRVDFAPQGDGVAVLKPGGQGLPLLFTFDGQIQPKQIFVGRRKASPPARDFTLAMLDRHALAWADVNGDGRLDAFITRGALGGTLRALPDDIARTIRDELLIGRADGRYDDVIAGSGIEKKDCSGRHARWVDFDGDGRLDLFVNCYDRENVAGDYPKQLYRQVADGAFRDVAAEVNLALPDQQIGSFAWVDLAGAAIPDLVAFQDEGFFVYRNRGGRFEREAIQQRTLGAAERIGQNESNEWFFDGKLVVADFNRDGYPDLFSASKRGNALLLNQGGRLSAVDPATVGLPARSATADWVDYDNDGLVDLFTFPQGLFRQRSDHTFERTGLLEFAVGEFRAALANWFDMDNDGRRDLLLVVDRDPAYRPWWQFGANKEGGAPKGWEVLLFRNVGAANHWLQIRVDGDRGNRQAIGGRVQVSTPDGTQTQDVGTADGAFFSQGHYRLYFGLGPHAKADAVSVRWPDGYRRELVNVAADSLKAIGRDAGQPPREAKR